MPVIPNRNFYIGVTITTIPALILLLASFFIGKTGLFLLLNANLGRSADFVFRYWTNLGDGAIWVPVVLMTIIYRKQFLPLVAGAILISTLFTQIPKNYICPYTPRPTYAIADAAAIHTVPGVELYSLSSFPSGHTTTAFTVFLLGCLLIRSKWAVPAGFIYAALVGYSRIYLAEHFPVDVGAGMLFAVITVFLSLEIQKRWTVWPVKK